MRNSFLPGSVLPFSQAANEPIGGDKNVLLSPMMQRPIVQLEVESMITCEYILNNAVVVGDDDIRVSSAKVCDNAAALKALIIIAVRITTLWCFCRVGAWLFHTRASKKVPSGLRWRIRQCYFAICFIICYKSYFLHK